MKEMATFQVKNYYCGHHRSIMYENKILCHDEGYAIR